MSFEDTLNKVALKPKPEVEVDRGEGVVDKIKFHPADYGEAEGARDPKEPGWDEPHPLILYFDEFTHPSTGNELVAGIDVNVLSPRESQILFGPPENPGFIISGAFGAGDGKQKYHLLIDAIDKVYRGKYDGAKIVNKGWRTWLASELTGRGVIGVNPEAFQKVSERLKERSKKTGEAYTANDLKDEFLAKHADAKEVPPIEPKDIASGPPSAEVEFEKEPEVDVKAQKAPEKPEVKFEPDSQLSKGEIEVSPEKPEKAPEVPELSEIPSEPKEPKEEPKEPIEKAIDKAIKTQKKALEPKPEPQLKDFDIPELKPDISELSKAPEKPTKDIVKSIESALVPPAEKLKDENIVSDISQALVGPDKDIDSAVDEVLGGEDKTSKKL